MRISDKWKNKMATEEKICVEKREKRKEKIRKKEREKEIEGG